MDYLRSAYTVDIRPYRNDPTRTVRIRWYRALPGATTLGVPTQFASRNWWDLPDLPPLGEDPATRRYSPGVPGVRYFGDRHCGTAEQWSQGILTTDPLPPVGPGGTPICCGPAVMPMVGLGLDFGDVLLVEPVDGWEVCFGDATEVNSPIPTACFGWDVSRNLVCTYTNFSDPCPALDGTEVTLAYDDGTGKWEFHGSVDGVSTDITMECDSLISQWVLRLSTSAGTFSPQTAYSVSSSPPLLVKFVSTVPSATAGYTACATNTAFEFWVSEP